MRAIKVVNTRCKYLSAFVKQLPLETALLSFVSFGVQGEAVFEMRGGLSLVDGQALAANRLELRWSRATVVNVPRNMAQRLARNMLRNMMRASQASSRPPPAYFSGHQPSAEGRGQ